LKQALIRTLAAAAFVSAMQTATAQEWSAGAVIGYGAYKNGSVSAASGSATVGVDNAVAFGARLTQDMYEHFSGEVGYLYQGGNPFLSSGSTTASIQGQSHSLDYTVLFHAMPRTSAFRPYFLAGGGGKDYRVTGAPPNPQPFPKIVALTNQSQWELLAVVGVGVKYRIGSNVVIRGEFRDYITPLPGTLFRVTSGASSSGLFHQLTPTVGLSYIFASK
jgi:hypothetical protein